MTETMNSRNQFLYPEWQIPVQDAFLEMDAAKLPEKVQAAEAIMFQRIELLGLSNGGRREHEALNHALSLLTALRDERPAG
jgi:hypothetical protein